MWGELMQTITIVFDSNIECKKLTEFFNEFVIFIKTTKQKDIIRKIEIDGK